MKPTHLALTNTQYCVPNITSPFSAPWCTSQCSLWVSLMSQKSTNLVQTRVFLAVITVNWSSYLWKMLYLQFWLMARGITENTFLYVNKLTKEKDGEKKIKKTAGHVLRPEGKIRVWYPRETTMDISRQALKDVSVCLSEDKHGLILPQTKTSSWKKTQIQRWPLLYLNIAGFPYNAWTLSKVPRLHVFRSDRKQRLAIRKDLSPFWTVNLTLNPWNDHSPGHFTKLNMTMACVSSQLNHRKLSLINSTGWAQL